jgi:hypothetical protein
LQERLGRWERLHPEADGAQEILERARQGFVVIHDGHDRGFAGAHGFRLLGGP